MSLCLPLLLLTGLRNHLHWHPLPLMLLSFLPQRIPSNSKIYIKMSWSNAYLRQRQTLEKIPNAQQWLKTAQPTPIINQAIILKVDVRDWNVSGKKKSYPMSIILLLLLLWYVCAIAPMRPTRSWRGHPRNFTKSQDAIISATTITLLRHWRTENFSIMGNSQYPLDCMPQPTKFPWGKAIDQLQAK